MQRLRPLLRIALAAVLTTLPSAIARAQEPPVDPAEAGGVEVVPIRIGPATLSGSTWFEGLATIEDDNHETIDTLRMRRARIGLAGSLTPRIGWNITGELTSQPALRNAFLTLRFTDQLNVRVGQATPPSGLERGTSPLAIELIDRSPVTTKLTYALDVGVTVTNADPYRGWLSYAVSLFNGSGLNRSDENDGKDMVARLQITPPRAPGFSVVATGGGGTATEGPRRLAGLGAHNDVPAFKVLVEGLQRSYERLPTSQGVVIMGVYRIRPRTVTPHFQKAELAARYSVLDDPASAHGQGPTVIDEDAPADAAPVGFVPATTRELQFGGNYYVNSNIRFMLNAIMPVDDRSSPLLTVVARLQLVF